MTPLPMAKTIMAEFAESTGLSKPERPPRRYLWTDAFAVCNFLELYRQTDDDHWRRLALDLVDQVHHILGRHRKDDPRRGWLSGLGEEAGERHPTMGGLRIGKPLKERDPSEPQDDRLEWERDGQYYHYLTKWMHALERVSRVTGDPKFNSWAIELAKTAHAAFVYTSWAGAKRMYWKMSIDLSEPLVLSMGHHDPLDGLITYRWLQKAASDLSIAPEPGLDSEIAELAALCKGINWATEDPLGIGGLLTDAYRVARLMTEAGMVGNRLVSDLLGASLVGLEAYTKARLEKLPAEYRLAFRELGMSVGLHVIQRIRALIEKSDDIFLDYEEIGATIDAFEPFMYLREAIESFWMEPQNRKSQTWIEHKDINSVMLATSLAPDTYLKV